METDCPYLPPHPHRGRRNEPAYAALTAAKVAELRGTDTEALGHATTRNAVRLFKITDA
jgi:TatD DNase family protein